MEIKNLLKLAGSYVSEHKIKFTINRKIFNQPNGRKKYNNIIRDNVPKKIYGIYIWVVSETNEIIYIGMAGRIKTDGSYSKHSIRERLVASRKKDKKTNKYIQTNDFVKTFMVKNNINSLDFYILSTKEKEPPAYLEAILLYNYYKKKNRLPILNNSF